MEKLEEWKEAKLEKYKNLSEAELVKKDLNKRRKIIKESSATVTASGSMWVTAGASAVAHGGLMFYHEGRAGKQTVKRILTKEALEYKGLERKKLGPGQVVGDVVKGMVNGGFGIAALEKIFDGK